MAQFQSHQTAPNMMSFHLIFMLGFYKRFYLFPLQWQNFSLMLSFVCMNESEKYMESIFFNFTLDNQNTRIMHGNTVITKLRTKCIHLDPKFCYSFLIRKDFVTMWSTYDMV
jgi:hypothetical protein